MSGLRIMSVPHCTDVFLPFVTMNKAPCGEAIGWCPDSELGEWSREDDKFVGLRIFNKIHGECWGHALKEQLPNIFDID